MHIHAAIAPAFNEYALIQGCNRLLAAPPLPQAESDKLEIDSILNNMFKLADFELKTLKANLTSGGRTNMQLTYIGTKAQLWIELGKLRNAGIDRKEIARVFSEYCRWTKTITSPFVTLDPDEIYKKMK